MMSSQAFKQNELTLLNSSHLMMWKICQKWRNISHLLLPPTRMFVSHLLSGEICDERWPKITIEELFNCFYSGVYSRSVKNIVKNLTFATVQKNASYEPNNSKGTNWLWFRDNQKCYTNESFSRCTKTNMIECKSLTTETIKHINVNKILHFNIYPHSFKNFYYFTKLLGTLFWDHSIPGWTAAREHLIL